MIASALIGYSLVAAVSTGANRPVEYIIGGLILLVASAVFADIYEIRWLSTFLGELFGAGDTLISLPAVVLGIGERAGALYAGVGHGGDPMKWGFAAVCWLAAATTALLLGLKRNRGRIR